MVTHRLRCYRSVLADHVARYRQMALVVGPRQVGKTTTCRTFADRYLDWDVAEHRRLIVAGQQTTAEHCGLHRLSERRPVLVFDELHKYPRWKDFLKGFFDLYADRCHILVTGSSRLDVIRRGGDSLMGRYLSLRMHPFTIAELGTSGASLPTEPIRSPQRPDEALWEALQTFGGFPEPLLLGDERFARRWRSLRREQLFREDLRDLTRIRDLALLEVMGELLAERSGERLVLSNLAAEVQVSSPTAKLWLESLCALHYGFVVRPWHRNLGKMLRKEPKWFLRDWAGIQDPGRRSETFIACHLLKAVEGWTDLGLGDFELRYLRDTRQREVDFCIVRDGRPWCLIEVKHGDGSLSPHLAYFQRLTGAPHALQVSMSAPYVDADCFAQEAPTVVPARSLLSQLL